MAFTIQVEGLTELMDKLDKAPKNAEKVAAKALYEGAGVIADAISRTVQGISTEPFKYAKDGRKRKPSPEEKAILTSAQHGVAKFKKNGMSVDTSVGFSNSGYGAITWNHARDNNSRTKYKQGSGGRMVHASQGTGQSMKPVPLIANAINSGTSFMEKQPFLRRAFSQTKGEAEAAIAAGIEKYADELGLE